MAKRTTADEKLAKVTKFFRSKPEFYGLKELEKKIPKECGISPMQVADILQNALDENLIHCEKVGSSNIYWSFKNEAHHLYVCENEKCLSGIEMYKEQNELRKKQLNTLLTSNKDNEERRILQEKYSKLKLEIEKFEREKYFAENYSKEAYDKLIKNIQEYKIGINKTIDNIYELKSYICNKYNLEKSQFDKNFNLTEGLDYIEL